MKPRVPLYGRFPFGHGTPLTESLTSFVTRLSHARSNSTTDVLKYLVWPLLPEPPTEQVGWYLHRGCADFDGLGTLSRAFVRAIDQLTGRSQLALHTLLPWESFLNPGFPGALHRGAKRWCSRCFAFWHQHGIPAREPLVWRVSKVRRCPVHRTVLSHLCPSCGKQQPIMNKRVPAGVCTSRGCGELLHKGDPLLQSGDVAPEPGSDDCWDIWTAIAVGRMLSLQTEMDDHAGSFGLVRLLVESAQRLGEGKSYRLAKHLGVSYNLIYRICDGHLPRLDYFLALTMRLGEDPSEVALAPYGTLFHKPWASYGTPGQPWPPFSWSRINRRVRYSAEFRSGIGRALDAATQEDGRRSLTEIARSLETSAPGVRYHFPEKAAELARLHTARRERERVERRAAQEKAIRDAVVQLVRSGIHPIARQTFALAGMSGSMHVKWMRAIWRDQKQRCGILD